MRSPLFQQRIRQLGPISGHEIASQHGAQGCHVAAGAAIAHDVDGLERQEDGEGLAGEAVAAFDTVGAIAERSFLTEMASVWRSRTVYLRTRRPKLRKRWR